MSITPIQCRAARGALEWTPGELARRAGLAETAVRDLERGLGDLRHERAIRLAFESAGVTFSDRSCVCFAHVWGGGERFILPQELTAENDG